MSITTKIVLMLILYSRTFIVNNFITVFGILSEMANLTENDVLKLARLARLNLEGDEVSEFQKEISKILDYVEQLNKADISDEEPTYQVTGLVNAFRADVEKSYEASPEELLKNAPDTKDNQIKVKRMIL